MGIVRLRHTGYKPGPTASTSDNLKLHLCFFPFSDLGQLRTSYGMNVYHINTCGRVFMNSVHIKVKCITLYIL